MTLAEFETAGEQGLQGLLLALWLAGRCRWQEAHAIAQEIERADGSWVHAYLHRVEGDAFNAGFWYRRAGRPMAHGDLRAEWERIVQEMLER